MCSARRGKFTEHSWRQIDYHTHTTCIPIVWRLLACRVSVLHCMLTLSDSHVSWWESLWAIVLEDQFCWQPLWFKACGDSINNNHRFFFQTMGTLQSPFAEVCFLSSRCLNQGFPEFFIGRWKSENSENELCAVLAPRAGESIKQANRMLI